MNNISIRFVEAIKRLDNNIKKYKGKKNQEIDK